MSLKKAVTEQVVAGLILAGVLYACSFIPGFYSVIWKFLTSAWRYTTASTTIPRWLLWCLILFAVTVTVRLSFRVLSRAAEPTVFDYRQDTILGLPWRWDYGSNGPRNLWCFCPACDTALLYSEEEGWSEYGRGRKVINLKCEHCGNRVQTSEGDRNYLIDRVMRQIDRVQRSGDWKKRIPDAKA